MKTSLSGNTQDANAFVNTEKNIQIMNYSFNLLERKTTIFKHFLKISLLLCLFFQAGNVKAQTSCVVDGVTITATGTASTLYVFQTDTACTASPFTGLGAWTSYGVSGGIVTYTFSSPVSSATVKYTLVDHDDIGTISVNGGGTASLSNPCGVTFSGLIISGTSAYYTHGNPSIKVTSTLPFTTITITNTGANTGWVQGNPCDITFTLPCNAGTTAPALSATTITNCPVNLNSLVTSTPPAGTTLRWYANNTATGSPIATPTAVGSGTYYAFYYDPTNNCHSPASTSVTVDCCPVLTPISN